MRIYKSFRSGNRITLFNGDCIDLLKSMPDESVDLVVTSPPYCIGKAYEDPHDDIETFKTLHTNIFNDIFADTGSDFSVFNTFNKSVP